MKWRNSWRRGWKVVTFVQIREEEEREEREECESGASGQLQDKAIVSNSWASHRRLLNVYSLRHLDFGTTTETADTCWVHTHSAAHSHKTEWPLCCAIREGQCEGWPYFEGHFAGGGEGDGGDVKPPAGLFHSVSHVPWASVARFSRVVTFPSVRSTVCCAVVQRLMCTCCCRRRRIRPC
jgi:hypothetical protein